MEITTSSSQLYNCLEIAEKALPVRSTVPMINGILFEVNEDNLTFSSTNLEMAIRVSMDYQCSEKGKILLPPKLVDVMRYFPVPEVNLIISWDNYRIDISGGSSHFNLNGADAQDYPTAAFSQIEPENSFTIEQDKLKKILRSVIFAASSEETRPAFNGILFSFNDQKITLTTSDTYRLVIKEIQDDHWAFEARNCLIPARVMREFLRIIDDSEHEVAIGFDNKAIAFNFDRIIFTSRLLEEKYPDVSGVIPNAYKTRIKIDRKMLEEVISRAALLAEGKNQAVNLVLNNNQLEASVSGQEGSMEELMPVEQDGEDINLHVNTRFVLDILKIIEDKEILIDFHGNDGPLIFKLVEDQSYLYLVLPIKKIN